MSEGMTTLEQNIARFEDLLLQMREATREAHVVLKDLRVVKREIEGLLHKGVEETTEKAIEAEVKKQLKELEDTVGKQTHLMYDKVGKQIDTLINLALGDRWAKKRGTPDIRPQLGEKLGEWIREIVFEEAEKAEDEKE